MSGRSKDHKRSFDGSGVSRRLIPTLANVKRPLSTSEATYVVAGKRWPSSDLYLQPRERDSPSDNLSEGPALLSDKSRSASTHCIRQNSPEDDRPLATPGTTSRLNETPQREERAEEYAEKTSQDSETTSTQSISSVSSSSRSSSAASSPVTNAAERTESKASETSATVPSKLKSTAAVSTAALSTCVETGEASITTIENCEDITAHRFKDTCYVAGRSEPLSNVTSRDTMGARDVMNGNGSKFFPTSKKGSMQASAELRRECDTRYVNDSPGAQREVPQHAAKSSSSSNISDVFVRILKKSTPKRKRIRKKASPETIPFAGTAGNSDAATRERRRSKVQSYLTPNIRMRHSPPEVTLERHSRASSLSLNGMVKKQQKGNFPQKGKETFDGIDGDGSFDSVKNLQRTNRPGTSWGKAETVVRSSYKNKTWEYSEAENLRPEDPNNAQTGDREDDVRRVQKEKIYLKECLLYPLAVCLLLGFTLVGAYLLLPMDPSRRHKARGLASAVCVSSGCLRDASYLSTLLSWDRVDPCVDFYAFVCDRWTSQYTASTPTSFPQTFDDDYASFLESKVRSMMINKSLASDSLQPIRHLYDKCISITRIDDEGWDPLLELMFDVSLEGFPLTPPVRSSKSVWEMAAKVLRKTGASALVAVGVAAHPVKDVGRDFLSVELPEILTGGDNVDDNDAVHLYTEAMFCALKVLKKEYLPPVHALSVVKFASDLEKLVHQVALTGGRSPVLEVLNTSLELQDFFVELFRGVENVHFSGPGSEVVLQFPSW
ncbi:hypothetical protein HPB49_015281 [Dermacentor silvarum]|uniref:Uncharacterized protein n=1 Tax=Dermacentor silvarum TaxID=543639 RepID=A0ACB8DEC0_DERSI|nr:hypothetical protein HPB49_015281 [Dermacentor silvarum]